MVYRGLFLYCLWMMELTESKVKLLERELGDNSF